MVQSTAEQTASGLRSPNNLTAVSKRRLLKLAELLEKDARNKKGVKFDLETWAAPSGSRPWERSWDRREPEIEVGCGTSACAVGLACISGAFKRAGLTFGYKKSFGGGFHLVPKFNGSREFRAVERFFEVGAPEAKFLFAADEYPENKLTGAIGERYVAKRIRDFVAGKVSP